MEDRFSVTTICSRIPLFSNSLIPLLSPVLARRGSNGLFVQPVLGWGCGGGAGQFPRDAPGVMEIIPLRGMGYSQFNMHICA